MIKVAIYSTGCLATMYLPSWVHWLNTTHPEVEYKVLLTESALKFVGSSALNVFCKHPFAIDSWDGVVGSPHIDLQEWPDMFFIHPASVNFLSKMANYLADSPLLLALQGTDKPITVAASTPPGFVASSCWEWINGSLSARQNITLLPPVKGFSARDPNSEGSPPMLFNLAFEKAMRFFLDEGRACE